MKQGVVLAFLLMLDVVTKFLASCHVPALSYGPYPFGGIAVFSGGGITCSLNYITNTGAAWGIFPGFSGVLFGLRALIILALFLFIPKKFPVWLVIAGALGNMLDY